MFDIIPIKASINAGIGKNQRNIEKTMSSIVKL